MTDLAAKAYLLLPLGAAVLYALGAIALAAASAAGLGSRRATVACNGVMGLLFLGFYDWTAFPSLPIPFWPVLLLALTFIVGQLFTLLSLRLGAVSSVTPVLGVKVILVNLFVATLLGQPVGPAVWLAGVLAVAGVALLQFDDRRPSPGQRRALALLCAFLAALAFAAFDTLIQHWSPIISFGRYVPPAMLLAALISLPLLITRDSPRPSVTLAGWRYLGVGALLFGLQGILLISSIGKFGDAAGANIVYSSRGLWSVALVWIVGRHFGNTELAKKPRRVVLARILGAALISSAILLVFA